MTSAKQIVPVDLGNLKNSGFVSLPEVGPNRKTVTVILAFGGPAGSGNHDNKTNKEPVGYAIIQHFDCTLNHPGHGQCRYLSKPVNRARKGLQNRVKKHIDEAVRRI